MTKVLIVDRSRSMRNTLRERLEYEGYATECAATSAAADQMCRQQPFDLILTDDAHNVPRIGVPFIVLAVESSVSEAVDAVRLGAIDFLPRPIDMNRLLGAIRKAVATTEPTEPEPIVATPMRPRRRGSRVEEIVGRSEAITHVRELIDKVAPSDARVLITGSNGTGKELVARWLHEKSRRAAAPFIEVNCAAIPSELIESELFGHEKGAFTSAIKQRKGKFEQAAGGTLFMDEIGDMSLSAQAKVLRALQENRISRVGSDRDIDVNVRVVAATNKNLREEIRRGNFREDLYHRLSVIVISVPSLADRREDIPLLVEHFVEKICGEYAIERKEVDPLAVELLQSMPWSGNIRELRNVIERLIILSDERITASDVERYAASNVL
ncbi:MAG: sigma-54-dependent Fis family transcriptional regulator [Rikenellaceae bacterium]|nr:sigma-54-dependent Fis family transcriptional regulator [Rikenellaceae bacterium]MBQ5371293.1 sigma-54-dependent Fis family transcriptional regulator [Rikenellaceae bacterium]MBQ5852858.1 sigma-54-dependent Fis family transcriptional regulator [Rikenellaceae bacterium]